VSPIGNLPNRIGGVRLPGRRLGLQCLRRSV